MWSPPHGFGEPQAPIWAQGSPAFCRPHRQPVLHTELGLCFSHSLWSMSSPGGRGVSVGPILSSSASDIFCDNENGPNFLFHNRGDGTFVDAAASAGKCSRCPVSSAPRTHRDSGLPRPLQHDPQASRRASGTVILCPTQGNVACHLQLHPPPPGHGSGHSRCLLLELLITLHFPAA